MNGKAWTSWVGQVCSSSHQCEQSGWEVKAPRHPDIVLPLPVPLRPEKVPQVPHQRADLSLTAQ